MNLLTANRCSLVSDMQDWAAGYYPPDLTQSNLVQRLLMYGTETPLPTGCIPYGNVEGLLAISEGMYVLGVPKVGFKDMNRKPMHVVLKP
ncbi:MAG: hypothetical protein FWG50_09095 [Kiritimatiellaeota bacterium]|nr:hypothetical protein [Kiritimatiellota bacterium]